MGVGGIGFVPLGNGFFGSGTGIGIANSGGVGLGIGVVSPGDVILWAINWGENAAELELMEIIVIIGKINSPKSTKMRSLTNLKFDISFDIDADMD